MKLNLLGKLSNVDNKERIISGYASVAILDSDNQYISKEVLSKGMESLFEEDDIYANLMLYHSNVKIGKILRSYKDLTTHVDEKGLYLVAKIRKGLNIANKTWNQILNNELNGLSIGAEILSDHDVCDKDSCISIVDKLNIYEVSVCNSPTNILSNFSVITKSKAKELGMDICNKIEKGDNMKDKKCSKEEEQEEENISEEKDLSIESIDFDKWFKDLNAIKLSVNEFISLINKIPEPKEHSEVPQKEQEKSKEDIKDDTEDFKEVLKSRDDIISKYESENKELKEQVESQSKTISELKESIKVLENKEQDPITSVTKEDPIKYESNFVRDGRLIYKKK